MSPTRWRLYISLRTTPRIHSLLGNRGPVQFQTELMEPRELRESRELMEPREPRELVDEVLDVYVEHEVA